MKIKKTHIFLILLLFFSLFFRIYKIDNLTLFGDEIDVGYQAYSLLKTGCDYKGNFLPTYIQSLAESRAPLLIYVTIPSIKIFGLTELGVRFPAIFFGVLSIYLFYKLIFILSKSDKLSFFSALALSFSPWHFQYSRAAFEVTLLICLIISGTYFFVKFIQTLKNKYIYFSIISFGLTFYTYNTSNIFVPFLVLFLIFSNFKVIKKKLNVKLIISTIILTLLFITPILIQILFGQAGTRFSSLSIINNQKIINQIVEKRTSFSAGNPQIEKIFYNKPIYFFKEFTKNYLESISSSFLFVTGDNSNLRHSIPGFGLIFLSFLPILLIGLFSIDFKKMENKIFFFWFIVSPIPSALTMNGGNHGTRLFLMIIPLSYFIGLGFKKISRLKFFKLFLVCFSLALIFESSLYFYELFVHYPKDSFEYWNRGYDQIFKNNPTNYNHLYISNAKYNSLLPFLFYSKYPPQDFIKNNVVDSGARFNLGEKITFINDWQNPDKLNEISKIGQKDDIFILFQGNDIPGNMDFSQKSIDGFNTIKTIYNPNKSILSQIIQKK